MSENQQAEYPKDFNPGSVMSTPENWSMLSRGISFDEQDYELLEMVLHVVPDLRVTAYIGKRARQCELKYPVLTAEQLAMLMGEERIEVGEFSIDRNAVLNALTPEMFPLAHEGEFLSCVYLALLRCRAETTQRWQRASIGHRQSRDEEE
jgi:hypothetical protein